MVRAEVIVQVRHALERLPPDYKQVIQLRRLEERSVAETAQIMKRSKGATHMLFWRAMEALRDVMQEQGAMQVTL